MAKHLPPSSSTLRLLDVGGQSGDLLAEQRADLEIRRASLQDMSKGGLAPCSFDAVVAFDTALSEALLQSCLATLREGGRFIAVESRGAVSESHLRRLRDQGYVRILIEPALDELGVLIRGEKPHTTADTQQRIQSIARADLDSLNLEHFTGRYIHLLIQQRPNKPAWKLEEGDVIAWRAAAIQVEPTPVLLGFSSLPKAVGFMQPVVLMGLIADINRVGKFSVDRARVLEFDIILNPAPETLEGGTLTFIEIDPTLAEAPDE